MIKSNDHLKIYKNQIAPFQKRTIDANTSPLREEKSINSPTKLKPKINQHHLTNNRNQPNSSRKVSKIV